MAKLTSLSLIPAACPLAVAIRAIWALGAVLAASASLCPAAHAMPPDGQRDFYDAVSDTLGDFEFDLKHDAVKGIESVAIRDISMTNNVPRSFASHLEDLMVERILRATKTKVIQCLGCKARRTVLNGDKIEITTARTDHKQLLQAAKARGILHFLDVTFAYQPTGIVISMTTTEPGSSQILWTHSYNSESSRAALLRRGLDMDQLDPSTRKATEYPPMLQYRFGVDYLFEPDIGTTTGCLGFEFRLVERYDNRKKELGFEAEYLLPSSTLMPSAPNSTSAATVYTLVNMTLFVLHGWNLIGSEEDYNKARSNLYAGIGGTFTAGFLGALIRGGMEYRMAKHFAATVHLGYRPASTLFLPLSSTAVSVSGVEYGGGLSYLF